MVFRDFIVTYFPFIGKLKRFIYAAIAQLQAERDSYSQQGEDTLIIEILQKHKKIEDCFYVDIGANHPSSISNTYKMYRNGASGITIEPFTELSRLHKIFRPRDTHLNIGCGAKNTINKLFISKTPVLSSFKAEEAGAVWKENYMPVFRLDTIAEALGIENIDFLSIDVEGLDFEVLMGAEPILAKVFLLCIEANNQGEEKKIVAFLESVSFELIKKNGCNLIFINNRIYHKQ